ncbi:MAG TPA: ABC transporter permease subunit [Pseudonocardiaceae bacterium]|nr:ABC transporter permease subunit [Pseudonocardiaceae bacterium]
MTVSYQSTVDTGGDGFARLLRAEWTKFHTVRGWTIGLVVAMLLTALFGLVPSDSCSNGDKPCVAAPVGPGGEAVVDRFYFVHQSLTGNGSITVRLASFTGGYTTHPGPAADGGPQALIPGLEPWSKAGVLIKAGLAQGSAYAALLATGDHGIRMQYDYTHDAAGPQVSATSPHWLRLDRAGDTITGYDSTDGQQWHPVGTAVLAGLPATVQVGMFATSPGHTVVSQSIGSSAVRGGPSQATGVMDNVDLRGSGTGNAWTGTAITNGQDGPQGFNGGFQRDGGTFTVRGSGDIAPDTQGGASITQPLVGTFFGLIAVAVVGAMFISAEYRRGLIRTTLVAHPRRGEVLAAKAIVLGAVTFVTGLAAAGFAMVFGVQHLRAEVPVNPIAVGTEIRIVVGTAALLAVAAMLALALGAVLRRGAGAVAAVFVVVVLPYLLGEVPTILPSEVQTWLLRITPAAAFAVQQAYPRYPQVDAQYSVIAGYYPLPPLAGLAVLCGYAALALILAAVLLRRRDV